LTVKTCLYVVFHHHKIVHFLKTLLFQYSPNCGIGVEYNLGFKDFVIQIRAGYNSSTDALIDFSLGFGFVYKDKLGINLAWTPSISELNQHILTAGVSFKF